MKGRGLEVIAGALAALVASAAIGSVSVLLAWAVINCQKGCGVFAGVQLPKLSEPAAFAGESMNVVIDKDSVLSVSLTARLRRGKSPKLILQAVRYPRSSYSCRWDTALMLYGVNVTRIWTDRGRIYAGGGNSQAGNCQ